MEKEYYWTKLEKHGHVAVLTINRLEKLNAISLDTAKEITERFREMNEDRDVRCVVLTGTGKTFSVGGDIAEMSKFTAMDAERALREVGQVLTNTVDSFRTPVIAAVNGYAFGGGTELALACDIIIAADTAQFSLPEVTLGTLPGWGGTQRAVRLLGRAKTIELLATGKRVSAQEALQFGLVNHVVATGSLMEYCIAFAQEIGNNPPTAVEMIKRVVKYGEDGSFETGLSLECTMSAFLFDTEDRKDRMKSFAEKSK